MVKLEYKSNATLGESPMWDERNGVLYWVDIPNGLLFRYRPTTQENTTFEIGQPIGAVALRERGGLVLAVRGGFVAFDPEKDHLKRLAIVEGYRPNNRFNDGKCDALGRFWAGTMSMAQKDGAGTIYVLDTNHDAKPCIPNITIPNGFVFSEDSLIYADSPERLIYRCSIDAKTGDINPPQPIMRVEEPMGVPDGMCLDAEGMIWIAHHGDGYIRRWDMRNQELLDEIKLPVSQTTACWFGGDDLKTLFITTASQEFKSADYAREPLAGSLFSTRLAVGGMPAYRFKG